MTLLFAVMVGVASWYLLTGADYWQQAARSQISTDDVAHAWSRSIFLQWTMLPATPLAIWLGEARALRVWHRVRPGISRALGLGIFGEAAPIADLLLAHAVLWMTIAALVLSTIAPVAPRALALGGACAGFIFPWLAAWSAQRRLQRQLLRDFPTMIELFALTVQAGVEFGSAVTRVADAMMPSLLAHELHRVQHEWRSGQPMAAAWTGMAQRLLVPQITRSLALIVQSQQLGTPLADTLHLQADSVRAERLQRAERAGALASQKILLPVACCILPANFLLVFGGLVVRVLQHGWHGVFL